MSNRLTKILILLAGMSLAISCKKDGEEGGCISAADYAGTYVGAYTLNLGGAPIPDTLDISVVSGTQDSLSIYSHIMGNYIYAKTQCEKFTLGFSNVSFSITWADIEEASGVGNGVYEKDQKRLKPVIKFTGGRAVASGFPTTPLNSSISLSGDFVKQ